MRHVRFIHRGAAGPEEVVVGLDGSRCVVTVGGRDEEGEAVRLPDGRYSLVFDGGRQICGRMRPGRDGDVEISTTSGVRRITLAEPLRDRIAHLGGGTAAVGGDEQVRALMSGRVVEIAVAAGDEVEAGALLLVLEAMKMQNEIRATRAGRVLRIEVEAGNPVEGGAPLLVLGAGA
jgi:glutaconyl-CoA/methylmalonyl-CoA decarboxylase subunit gamma